eukprot:12983052-Heterocapsa_arctica.AAC.1
MRDQLVESLGSAFIRWLQGPQQVADALTKICGSASVLEQIMAGGGWSLKESAAVRATRDAAREQHKARESRAKHMNVQPMGLVFVGYCLEPLRAYSLSGKSMP